MNCRDAILDYLKSHKTFFAHSVAKKYGLSTNGISQMARRMEQEKILIQHSRRWRDCRYRLREIGEEDPEPATIIEQCKASPAMQRVLAFYGKTQGAQQ